MELVEGEDLSQRIARGPIPLDEALPIGRQIAEALEAAHEQGIIHRDLKPANIKVRADGMVKVLDFGLAKLRAGEVSGDSDYGRDSTDSPTLTSPAMMTGAGMILGTAAYMSPEQARGRPVDKRADIWSFGVVLFEMLTGQRLFSGETISDTLASVLKTEPNWHALPAAAPPRLRGLLRRCLDKDAKRRLRDIGDARVQIEELLSGAPDEAGVSAIPTPQSVWQRALPWGVAAAAVVVAAAATTRWSPWRNPSSSAPLRLNADLGADVSQLGRRTERLAGRRHGRVRGAEGRGAESPALRATTQPITGHALVGDRQRRRSVLFAGRPVDRVFRRRQAEEDRRHGRPGRHTVRCAQLSRRRLG